MKYKIFDESGEVSNVIVATQDFVEAHYPDRWELIPPTDKPLRPDLVILSVTSEDFILVGEDFSEITVYAGTSVSVEAKLMFNEQVVPLSGAFRMPIRARDGREFVVLATLNEGTASMTISFKQSGVWAVTSDLINEGLPVEQQMDFKGVMVYVIEL